MTQENQEESAVEVEVAIEDEIAPIKREDLSSRSVCSAYVRGSKCISKPKMVDKMLKPEGMRFNFFAWIIGPYYYLYRKQWKIGWIWLVICFVMTFVTSVVNNEMLDAIGLSMGTNAVPTFIDYAWIFIGGIGGIVMGFLFYPLYRRSAERAYDEWKQNADVQEDANAQEAAERYIESKGGTNLAAGLGTYIAAVIFVCILTLANPQSHGTGIGDYAGPAGSTTYEFMYGATDDEGRTIYTNPDIGAEYVATPVDEADVSVSVERAE